MSGLQSPYCFYRTWLCLAALNGIGIVLLAACSYSGVDQKTSGVHFPSARTEKDGDTWLIWDKAQRLAFIKGYIQGNRDGHQKGCGTAEQLIAANGKASKVINIFKPCLDSMASFTDATGNYEASITSFYQKYPVDREVPMRLVLQFMSDESRKTPEQIHGWFVARWGPCATAVTLGCRRPVA